MKTWNSDIFNSDNPYWPRVRRLHACIWANGTLGASNAWIVFGSAFFIFINVILLAFSWAWRGALMLAALFLFDKAVPGIVPCIFRDTVGARLVPTFVSSCSLPDDAAYRFIFGVVVLFMLLIMIYPIRRFLIDVLQIVFIGINLLGLGFPMKWAASIAAQEPTVAGIWLDNSDAFGPLTAGFVDAMPPAYLDDWNSLWDAYRRSQSPAHHKELEQVLTALEAKYFP